MDQRGWEVSKPALPIWQLQNTDSHLSLQSYILPLALSTPLPQHWPKRWQQYNDCDTTQFTPWHEHNPGHTSQQLCSTGLVFVYQRRHISFYIPKGSIFFFLLMWREVTFLISTQQIRDETGTQTHLCIYFSPTLTLLLYHVLSQVFIQQLFIEHLLWARHIPDIGERLVNWMNMALCMDLKVEESK